MAWVTTAIGAKDFDGKLSKKAKEHILEVQLWHRIQLVSDNCGLLKQKQIEGKNDIMFSAGTDNSEGCLGNPNKAGLGTKLRLDKQKIRLLISEIHRLFALLFKHRIQGLMEVYLYQPAELSVF